MKRTLLFVALFCGVAIATVAQDISSFKGSVALCVLFDAKGTAVRVELVESSGDAALDAWAVTSAMESRVGGMRHPSGWRPHRVTFGEQPPKPRRLPSCTKYPSQKDSRTDQQH